MQETKTTRDEKQAAFLHRRMAMPLLMTLFIVVLTASGFLWANKTVYIYADGVQTSVTTLYKDPAAVLVKAGITLGEQDEYRLSTAELVSGTTIQVYRAVPVTIAYQGQVQEILTAKPTVAEVAESRGILQDNVRLNPDPAALVTANMNIVVVTITEKQVEQQETAPFPIVRRPDPYMELGEEEVESWGQDGVKMVTRLLHLEDGIQTMATIIAERTTVSPTPQIVRVGTRDVVETSRGDMRFKRIEYMEATAYTPTDGSWHGITASGIPARRGIVAVDPRVIPLGSRLYVSGYGLALAADTGGDIVGNRIDVCIENSSEAWRYGRQPVKVYILAE